MSAPHSSNIELLIAQRTKVSKRLALIASIITSTNNTLQEKIDVDANYLEERGGDLEIFKLRRPDEKLPAIANIGIQPQSHKVTAAVVTQNDASDSRHQVNQRRCSIDYSVILDADVFSANRKGKPLDKSIAGIGGTAEQVKEASILYQHCYRI